MLFSMTLITFSFLFTNWVMNRNNDDVMETENSVAL